MNGALQQQPRSLTDSAEYRYILGYEYVISKGRAERAKRLKSTENIESKISLPE